MDSLNNEDAKLVDISGIQRRNIGQLKLMYLKLTVRSKISETCLGVSLILSRVTNPTTNIVKGKKGDLFTDSHSILVKWRNHFS